MCEQKCVCVDVCECVCVRVKSVAKQFWQILRTMFVFTVNCKKSILNADQNQTNGQKLSLVT